MAVVVDHGEHVSVALRDDFDQLTKRHFREDRHKIRLEHTLHLEQREDVTVFVMRE